MDVKEKLVELLQSAPADIMGNHGVGALADHLIANGVTVQEWISVKDRLPEDRGYYLVAYRDKYNESISVAYDAYVKCSFGEWWGGEFTHDISKRVVTHWMPLPEPPKGE